MTMTNDWAFATQFRDVIVSICEGVIGRLRPSARYATVVTIDRANRTCTVRFPGETNPVTMPMGAIQPASPGQTVRVLGTLGDRYIDTVVMGDATFAGGLPIGALIDWPTGVSLPSGFISANGAYYEPSTYPTLFGFYGFSQGQQGQQFRVPTSAGQILRAA